MRVNYIILLLQLTNRGTIPFLHLLSPCNLNRCSDFLHIYFKQNGSSWSLPRDISSWFWSNDPSFLSSSTAVYALESQAVIKKTRFICKLAGFEHKHIFKVRLWLAGEAVAGLRSGAPDVSGMGELKRVGIRQGFFSFFSLILTFLQ